MNIGFTTTSFRQIRSLKKIVKIAIDSNASCIEWGGDYHVKDISSAKLARTLCDEAGIKISSYGSYYRVGSNDTAEWKRICEIANTLGARSVRVWLGKADSEKTDDKTYSILVDDAKSMCRIADEYGLIVASECHDNTFNNNTDAFLRIQKDIGCDIFRTYFQSRYKKLEYDLDRFTRTLPFIESIHISYSEQAREQFPRFDPDYINILLDKVNSSSFDGNILIEYTYLFSWAGIPSSMQKDIMKIKSKVGK